jgi:hypothetical protein
MDEVSTRLEGEDWHVTLVLREDVSEEERTAAVDYLLVTLMDLCEQTTLGERICAAHEAFLHGT